MTSSRQQVLFLWTAEAAFDSPVIAWSFHDGTGGEGPPAPTGSPPYRVADAALGDGWFLLQTTPPPAGAADHSTGILRYEFVFERRVDPARRSP